jgi:hypothetical protein
MKLTKSSGRKKTTSTTGRSHGPAWKISNESDKD